jgi:Family of unknown function (DUF6289)
MQRTTLLNRWQRMWLSALGLPIVALMCVSVATSIRADQVQEVCLTYYSDSSFTTIVGAWLSYCDASPISSGTTSNYRFYHRENCLHGGIYEHCDYLNNGSWEIIACPSGMATPYCF